MADEQQPENPRQACPGCGAVYRYASDLEEHKNVGCKITSKKKKSASLKAEPEAAE